MTTVERFLSGAVDPSTFGHHDHVRVAWELVRSRPVLDAIGALEDGLRELTTRAGAPEKLHITITYALAFLIADRVADAGAGADAGKDWGSFAAANSDLLEWPCPPLSDLYTPEVLASQAARERFILPH